MSQIVFSGYQEALEQFVYGSYLYEPKFINGELIEHWIVDYDGFKYSIKNKETIHPYNEKTVELDLKNRQINAINDYIETLESILENKECKVLGWEPESVAQDLEQLKKLVQDVITQNK